MGEPEPEPGPVDEWEVVRPRRRGRNGGRGKGRGRSRARTPGLLACTTCNHPHEESDGNDGAERALAQMHEALSAVRGSALVGRAREQLLPQLQGVRQIVCYGVGDVAVSNIARLQLALAMCLATELQLHPADIFFYDPVLSGAGAQVIKEHGLNLIGHNENCRRRAGCNTLYFMPHCDRHMYDNVIAANIQLADGGGSTSVVAPAPLPSYDVGEGQNWTCAECSDSTGQLSVNWPARKVCFRCEAPRRSGEQYGTRRNDGETGAATPTIQIQSECESQTVACPCSLASISNGSTPMQIRWRSWATVSRHTRIVPRMMRRCANAPTCYGPFQPAPNMRQSRWGGAKNLGRASSTTRPSIRSVLRAPLLSHSWHYFVMRPFLLESVQASMVQLHAVRTWHIPGKTLF